MAKIIGIDLGTTYSALSIWNEKQQKSVMIPNLRGNSTTPSVVSINEANEVIVGEDAKQNLAAAPDDTVSQVKREMGNDFKVTMKGQEHNPQTISAFILRYLKTCAEKYLGEPVHDAVITVPAYFKEVQKSATRDAGIIAGLNVSRLINEPTAAAIAYGINEISDEDSDENNTYAVYDLGGGTFDVSIIEIGKEDIQVVGTGGDSRLGGLDMDEAIMKWSLRKIKEKYQVDLSGNEEAKQRLKAEAEDIKKTLVVAENATLNIPFLTIIDNKPFTVKLDMSRTQFNMLIKPLIKRSLICLDKAMASAKKKNETDWEDLKGVILVGGPTRLHIIKDMITEKLESKLKEKLEEGKKNEMDEDEIKDLEAKLASIDGLVRCDLNPDEVVAMGAAIVGAGLKPIGQPPEKVETMTTEQVEEAKNDAEENIEAPSIDIYDVTGHSLGIAVEGHKFHKIIEKESVIPVEMSQDGFTNGGDYTKELLIEAYQGEEEFVAANTKIGQVRIQGLEPMPKGQQHFKVAFKLDISGTLSTVCTDLRTKKEYKGSFNFDAKDGIKRMSSDEIKKNRAKIMEQMAGAKPQQEAAATTAETSEANAPNADVPQSAGPIPELEINSIPEDWRDYWVECLEKIGFGDEKQKAKMVDAMTKFANAVKAGDATEIEDKAYLLQDVLVEFQT